MNVALSSAAYNGACFDDILSLAHQFLGRPAFVREFVQEIIRTLRINVDYSDDLHHDNLVRNQNLQVCLSVLKHLGWKGEYQQRDFTGTLAKLTLDIRNIVILITIASNTPSALQGKLQALDDSDVVDALAGCAKWALDLLAWITNSLFRLLEDPVFQALLTPEHFLKIVPYLISKNEAALHLLLCSSSRGFISALCRRLFNLDTISKRVANHLNDPSARPQPPALTQAYAKMHRYTSRALLNVDAFNAMIVNEIAVSIQNVYSSMDPNNNQQPVADQQGNPPKKDKRFQMQTELMLLLGMNPPLTFLPAIQEIFTKFLPDFRAKTNLDTAELFFADYSTLEVDDDPQSLATRRARGAYVDVFRRTVLLAPSTNRSEDHWRRCVRCANIMEEANVPTGARPGFTFVVSQQKRCSCGGNWGLVPKNNPIG